MVEPTSATQRRRPASMMEVARRAGTSQKTVSRVVNGEPHVREELRLRIQQAIRELDFRPNAAARSLVTRRTRRIGVVAFGTSMYGPRSVLAAIESVARSDGYALSVLRTDAPEIHEVQSAVDALLNQGVEGIVLSEPLQLGGALRVTEQVAVLTMGPEQLTERSDELLVGADEFAGARIATEHLLELGHKTVHHIAGPDAWKSSVLRSDGWLSALAERGIAAPAAVFGDWSPSSGFTAMRALLQTTAPTAVFVANDQMAIGAIAAIEQQGLRVPRDISIVGFDDLDVAEYLSTPLTTMRQEFNTFARLGMSHLIRAIDGQPPDKARQLVPATLIERATTGAPPVNR